MIRRLRPAGRGDRGSITPLIPIVLLALFILGGLVVDGSRDLDARGDAQAYAEEAARAGATAVDLSSATLRLDQTVARQRVSDYCSAIEKNQTVTVLSCGLDGGRAFTDAPTCGGVDAQIVVHTEVKLQIDTTLLGIVGPTRLSASGHAKARPIEGTNSDNAC
jgi:Flp pilus assembly protein TadG